MWVRAEATVPSPIESVEAALAALSPQTLAALAQEASRDGCHLRAQLAGPIQRNGITTTHHLRWWNDCERSLTPSLDGELQLRSQGPASTGIAITANYRCRATLGELADSMFLRRIATSVANTFLGLLAEYLPHAQEALVPEEA
jgi:hypothetical protein